MKNTTLRKKFIPKLLLIILPLVIFINLYNVKITDILRDQAASSGTVFSKIYMREIDTELSDLHNWLVNLSNDDAHISKFSSNEVAIQKENQTYYNNLFKSALELHPTIDMVFAISTKYPYNIILSSKNVTYDEHQNFANLANGLAEYQKSFDTDWIAIHAPNETECWLSSVIVLDDVVFGIMAKPQTILSTMPFSMDNSMKFVLAKHNGTIVLTTLPKEYEEGIDLTGDLSHYYMTGTHENIIVSGAESTEGPFRLLSITSDKEIQRGINWARWISIILLFVSIISLIGIYFGINKSILKPLEKIDNAIKSVGQANFSQNLIPQNESREFTNIYSTFNHMTNQIEALKIENYEQLIHKQQAELRFYQTQIKPHFILNCLTTIQNLAKQQKTDELICFVSDFARFARYMFRTDFTLVSLNDELAQVKHYISMQKFRFPDLIFYVADIDSELSDFQIPSMIIQTLVENSVKHGMDENTGISIFVQCKKETSYSKNGIQISVEDSGSGFPESVLAAINNFDDNPSSLGFGLKNILAVLELTYGTNASLHVENVLGSGGKAVITIFPPELTM